VIYTYSGCEIGICVYSFCIELSKLHQRNKPIIVKCPFRSHLFAQPTPGRPSPEKSPVNIWHRSMFVQTNYHLAASFSIHQAHWTLLSRIACWRVCEVCITNLQFIRISVPETTCIWMRFVPVFLG
jgi:hypothetical protein